MNEKYIIAILTEANKYDGGDFYNITCKNYKEAIRKINLLIKEKYNNNIVSYCISEEKFIEEL